MGRIVGWLSLNRYHSQLVPKILTNSGGLACSSVGSVGLSAAISERVRRRSLVDLPPNIKRNCGFDVLITKDPVDTQSLVVGDIFGDSLGPTFLTRLEHDTHMLATGIALGSFQDPWRLRGPTTPRSRSPAGCPTSHYGMGSEQRLTPDDFAVSDSDGTGGGGTGSVTGG